MSGSPVDPGPGSGTRRAVGVLAACAGADVLAVVVFVLLGLRAHGDGLAVFARVIWPFLAGLAVGWVILLAATRLDPRGLRAGLIMLLTTAPLGMVLRRVATDRSTPLAFVLVGSTFLTLFLLGWRVLADWLGRRRAGRSGAPGAALENRA